MHLVISIALGIVAAHFLIEYINNWRERRRYRRGMQLLYPARHEPPPPAVDVPKPKTELWAAAATASAFGVIVWLSHLLGQH
jgi:hypothetical protein